MGKFEQPILFLSGLQDELVPLPHMQMLSTKALEICGFSKRHAYGIMVQRYRGTIQLFLDRYISEIKQCNLNCEVDDDKNDEQELYGLISSIKIKGTARQLTTAYAPQQNRVVEHKDRTVIEMARLVFWAEAMCIDSYVSIFLICVQ